VGQGSGQQLRVIEHQGPGECATTELDEIEGQQQEGEQQGHATHQRTFRTLAALLLPIRVENNARQTPQSMSC